MTKPFFTFYSLIFCFVLVCSSSSSAQTKKEQISFLQLRIDSLSAVLEETKLQLNDSRKQLKDKISSSTETETRLNAELSSKSKTLQELTDKNAKLNSQLTILTDSVVKVNYRVKDYGNQLASLMAESDRLKADLEKHVKAVSNSTTSDESLWYYLSDVNGVYAIQKPIAIDWDFPKLVTVNIDTKSVRFNAFKVMETYKYGMKVLDGTIHLIFGDVSEDTGDYLGGGEISFTAEGIKLSVYTGTEAEIEQVYFKALNK
jgi:predicted nuclease with TOPRIM domain